MIPLVYLLSKFCANYKNKSNTLGLGNLLTRISHEEFQLDRIGISFFRAAKPRYIESRSYCITY